MQKIQVEFIIKFTMVSRDFLHDGVFSGATFPKVYLFLHITTSVIDSVEVSNLALQC